MNAPRKLSLSLSQKLIICCSVSVALLSMFHYLSYRDILSILRENTVALAEEHTNRAVTRLEQELENIQGFYTTISYYESFQEVAKSGAPTNADQVVLYSDTLEALALFEESKYIKAYAILFTNSEGVVSFAGNYTAPKFWKDILSAEVYSSEYWETEKTKLFSSKYYPETQFSLRGEEKTYLPLALRSYWNSGYTILLFLDFPSICKIADSYLMEDFYLFSESGTLLYCSEEIPTYTDLYAIESLKYGSENLDSSSFFIESENGSFIIQREVGPGGLICMKVVRPEAIIGQISKTSQISLLTLSLSSFLAIAMIVFAVLRLLKPISGILELLPSSENNPRSEFEHIQNSIHHFIAQQEEYNQQIQQHKRALAGLILQSQLKNIAAPIENKPLQEAPQTPSHLILFRIHYRSSMHDNGNIDIASVTGRLLRLLQMGIQQYFQEAIIFQQEQRQFIARVSLFPDAANLDASLKEVLALLAGEDEYAFFTIVISDPLGNDSELSTNYTQMVKQYEYSRLLNETQLLHQTETNQPDHIYRFSEESEHALYTAMHEGLSDKAILLTNELMQYNLQGGITRIGVSLLCINICSLALRVLSNLHLSDSIPNLHSGDIYNEVNQCDTFEDFLELITGYVHSTALFVAQNADSGDPIIIGIEKYLQNNYQHEFSILDMAESLRLSKNYLSTYYKSKTGTNLSERIQFYRIQKAMELIDQHNILIGDVGAMVGMESSNTFLRQFKKYVGMTPTEYRLRK